MKTKQILILLLVGSTTLFSCKREGCMDSSALNYDEKAKEDDGSCEYETSDFTVTIENVQSAFEFSSSGVFNTPVGTSSPAGAGPGNSYQFTVLGGPGSKLSFATMFVGSNDLFFSPDADGIDLFNGSTPVSGDITSQIYLWDAGTEVNEMPGSGMNQPANQSGPNTGTNENGTVEEINNVNDGFTYPSVSTTINVSLAMGSSDNEFIVTIENLSSSTTPIAPGVWVVHEGDSPLFMSGSEDYGFGLEALAEDGDPSGLAADLESKAGLYSPFAPGAWAVHSSGTPIFISGSAASSGLETLAEDGDPSGVESEVAAVDGVSESGVFNTPQGASGAGPLLPGSSYEFTFTATKGDKLSLSTMYVQSNDLFFGFEDTGLELWSGDVPISGDVTSSVNLWDAGTEVNEYPGIGLNQPLRQSSGNTGTNESGTVHVVDDGFDYSTVSNNIKITIESN